MNHQEKIDKMVEELSTKEFKPRVMISPPYIYRLLWKFGINVPPPLFSSFKFNFLFFFLNTALMSFIFMFLYQFFLYIFLGGYQLTISLKIAANIGIKSAILFGFLWSFFMSLYIAYLRDKYKLPLWKDYK